MKTMEARYPGTCARTGRPIAPGDIITFERIGRRSRAVLVGVSDRFTMRFIDDIRVPMTWGDAALAVALGAMLALLLVYWL